MHTLEKIPKPPQGIKRCSENSFTYLSYKRIGSEFCSSKLIALWEILRYLAYISTKDSKFVGFGVRLLSSPHLPQLK
jgi:hypothetical protein